MMESPEELIIRPKLQGEGAPTGDLLSQVLTHIRLSGDQVYLHRFQTEGHLELEPRAAYVCMLKAGCMDIASDGEAPIKMETGDLMLLSRDCADLQITASEADGELIVCRFWFDASSLQSMLFALPRLIHIKRADVPAGLEHILHSLLFEAEEAQPGWTLMTSRLIELIVIRALRTWVHQGRASGWLGGLSDARLARVLRTIHEQPAQRWSVEALAKIAQMSRSNFCDRFAALVGCSPLRYQNECRLKLAKDMLGKRNARVGEVGLAIGYESEAAFSRAYKAFFGHSPRDDAKI
jgi:AraC-like DNA-binding protein